MAIVDHAISARASSLTPPSSRHGNKLPLFLYHCRDDEVVPFAHLGLYAQLLPRATVRAIYRGGHQLNGDLSAVAHDIERLTAGG